MERDIDDIKSCEGQSMDRSDQKARKSLRLESGALFADASEIVIRHGGEDYSLRITRQNRLLLTK